MSRFAGQRLPQHHPPRSIGQFGQPLALAFRQHDGQPVGRRIGVQQQGLALGFARTDQQLHHHLGQGRTAVVVGHPDGVGAGRQVSNGQPRFMRAPQVLIRQCAAQRGGHHRRAVGVGQVGLRAADRGQPQRVGIGERREGEGGRAAVGIGHGDGVGAGSERLGRGCRAGPALPEPAEGGCAGDRHGREPAVGAVVAADDLAGHLEDDRPHPGDAGRGGVPAAVGILHGEGIAAGGQMIELRGIGGGRQPLVVVGWGSAAGVRRDAAAEGRAAGHVGGQGLQCRCGRCDHLHRIQQLPAAAIGEGEEVVAGRQTVEFGSVARLGRPGVGIGLAAGRGIDGDTAVGRARTGGLDLGRLGQREGRRFVGTDVHRAAEDAWPAGQVGEQAGGGGIAARIKQRRAGQQGIVAAGGVAEQGVEAEEVVGAAGGFYIEFFYSTRAGIIE